MRYLIFFVLLSTQHVYSDELLLKVDPRVLGYFPEPIQNKTEFFYQFDAVPYSSHSLPWPVTFFDEEHSLGNPMAQFQCYNGSDAYFHGGSDLRSESGAFVYSPVAGHLSGAYYAYQVQADGSLKKFTKPWNSSDGDPLYFELSVVLDNGFRFEFHHVDPRTLTSEVKSVLAGGSGKVVAGQKLGQVVEWPVKGKDGTHYHHVHYNVLDGSGARWNPEYLSYRIQDQTPPQIHDVFAVFGDQTIDRFKGGLLSRTPLEFVVAVTDRIDSNVYIHMPSQIELVFQSGEKFFWDFRQKLQDSLGQFPHLWSVFKKQLKTPEGTTLRTQGDYENQLFLVRLPIPAKAYGEFQIRVIDGANNSANIQGELKQSLLRTD